MNLSFKEITEQDIADLTRVMIRAFDDDARKHLGREKGGPEGYSDGEFFRKWVFSYEESRGYKILLGDQVIGGFVVWVYEDRPNILGTIFVDPAHQDRGVGTRVWEFIEATYPAPDGWQLGTPSYAVKNLHFYEHKCGFRKIKESPATEHPGTSLIYEKSASGQIERPGSIEDKLSRSGRSDRVGLTGVMNQSDMEDP